MTEPHRDQAFLTAFEDATIPAHQFHHRDHVRVAWLYLTRHGRAAAIDRACSGIRRLTHAHGVAHKYHHTITRAWVEVIADHVARAPDVDDLDEFMQRHSALLDKRLLTKHYRSTTLASPAARSS